MLQTCPFFRLIRCSRKQKLNPILQPIFGKNENCLFKLFPCDSSRLRHCPELLLQDLTIGHIVI